MNYLKFSLLSALTLLQFCCNHARASADTGTSQAPPEEYVTEHDDIRVATNGDVQKAIHSSFKVAGKNLRAGNCLTLGDVVPFPNQIQLSTKHTLLYAKPDQPGLFVDSAAIDGGVTACGGRAGVLLKPGLYSWNMGVSATNYVYKAKDHDLLLLMYSLPATSKNPITSVTGEITFERLTLGGMTKSMPLELVKGEAMLGTFEDIWAYTKPGEKSLNILSYTKHPEDGEVLRFKITRTINPGDIAFVVFSWPARVYIDR